MFVHLFSRVSQITNKRYAPVITTASGEIKFKKASWMHVHLFSRVSQITNKRYAPVITTASMEASF
jgi:hypothetical protein